MSAVIFFFEFVVVIFNRIIRMLFSVHTAGTYQECSLSIYGFCKVLFDDTVTDKIWLDYFVVAVVAAAVGSAGHSLRLRIVQLLSIYL